MEELLGIGARLGNATNVGPDGLPIPKEFAQQAAQMQQDQKANPFNMNIMTGEQFQAPNTGPMGGT